MSNSGDGIFAAVVCVVIVGLIGVIVFLTGMTWAKTDGGHYAVVRNGGPLDNNKIRDVIQPGSSRKWEGMFSQIHNYPSSQRYYTITGDAGAGDRPGVDVFQGSTSDGVQVGLEGTVQFTLDGDPGILRTFDNRFGTRTFPVIGKNDARHPWDGDEGWNAFLDAVFRRQVLDNALRIEVQKYQCIELIPSCKYVRAQGDAVSGDKANQNLAQIQQNIAQELQSDFDSTLGGHFIKVGTFRISRVQLPPNVQEKINEANAAKVEIQHQQFVAQQRVATAIGQKNAKIQEALGIKALNAAYAKSPAKARIDAIAALPKNLTTLVIGGNGNQSLLLGGK